MIIELRRYGIVVKSMPVTGDKASIGSGADRDIRIEDPYLAEHVGDIVRRGETWHIVDAGTSLDGIRRDGERIDDEAIVAGRVYSISGFELVAQLPAAPAARPASVSSSQGEPLIPGTIMESVDVLRRSNAAIPQTVVEMLPPRPREPEIPSTVFDAPIPRRPPAASAAQAPVQAVQPATAAPARPAAASRRIILLVAVFAMGFLLLLLLLVKGGDKKKEITAPPTASPVASTTSAPAPPPAPVATPATPTELLASLNYDRALESWERELAKADDPAIRKRYADVALEIGRIHAANRSPEARGYFERAVKFGPADSQAVAEAKRRLGS